GHAVEEDAEDPGGQVVVAHEGVLEVRVAGCAVDRTVHPQVPAHQLVAGQLGDVERVGRVGEVLELRAQRGGRRSVLSCAARRQRLELDADVGDVGQVRDVDGRREG